MQLIRRFKMRLSHESVQLDETLTCGCFGRVDETQKYQQLHLGLCCQPIEPTCARLATMFLTRVCVGVQTW